MENGKIVLKNDKGETLECDVLFTFDSDETNKSYIVYTDNTLDSNGNIKTYANVYDPKGKNLDLQPIKTKEEWQVIENILSSVQEQVKECLDEKVDDENGEN